MSKEIWIVISSFHYDDITSMTGTFEGAYQDRVRAEQEAQKLTRGSGKVVEDNEDAEGAAFVLYEGAVGYAAVFNVNIDEGVAS